MILQTKVRFYEACAGLPPPVAQTLADDDDELELEEASPTRGLNAKAVTQQPLVFAMNDDDDDELA